MKKGKIDEVFLGSSAVILFVGGVFVLWTTFGENRVLEFPDALLPLSERTIFLLASAVLLAVSATLLLTSDLVFRLMLTIWMSTTLLAYHFGACWVGGANLFLSLGNLDSPVTLSPRTLNVLFQAGLGWMLVGSVGLLAARWIKSHKWAKGASSSWPGSATAQMEAPKP